MNEHQRSKLAEIVNDPEFADSRQPEDEYILCNRIEQLANTRHHLGIPWPDIHNYVKKWLRGDG